MAGHRSSSSSSSWSWILHSNTVNATFSTQAQSKQYFEEDIDLFDFEFTPAGIAKLNAKSRVLL